METRKDKSWRTLLCQPISSSISPTIYRVWCKIEENGHWFWCWFWSTKMNRCKNISSNIILWTMWSPFYSPLTTMNSKY